MIEFALEIFCRYFWAATSAGDFVPLSLRAKIELGLVLHLLRESYSCYDFFPRPWSIHSLRWTVGTSTPAGERAPISPPGAMTLAMVLPFLWWL
jgi:hypothetical protein